MNIDNGFLVAEADFGRLPDEFLPKRAGPCRGRIDLKLERPLKANFIEDIAEQARKTRGRNENLHRVNAALLDSRYWAGCVLNIEDFNPVNLAGESAADKFFYQQMHTGCIRFFKTGDIVNQLRARVISADSHRPMKTKTLILRLKLPANIGAIFRYRHLRFLSQ